MDTSQGKKRSGADDVPRLAEHVEDIAGRLTNILTAQARSGKPMASASDPLDRCARRPLDSPHSCGGKARL
jgi:hypothetical protein